MASGSGSSLTRGVFFTACILHASAARSDEAGVAREAPVPAAKESIAPASRAASTACQADMIEVEGTFCPSLDQVCIKRPTAMSYRCSEYRAPSGSCQTGTAQKHFCIDTYEWPNKAGETPAVMKSWYEARDACQSVGKRLCTQDEWTLACEGPEHLPYPYGFARDADACNIDKPAIQVDESALKRPDRRAAEVARLWQGEASGARERCVSPFGVHDMTGNVDEWTVNETGNPHQSALKGGYWSWVRGRCRAVTAGHEESFRYYQIGWRCCANPSGSDVGAGGSQRGGGQGGAGTGIAGAGSAGGGSAGGGGAGSAGAGSVGAGPARAGSVGTSNDGIAGDAGSVGSAGAGSAASAGSATAALEGRAPPRMRAPERPRAISRPPPAFGLSAEQTSPPLVHRRDNGSGDAVRGPQRGEIGVPAHAAGHRIFVDGRVTASAPGAIAVDCGRHTLKVGHDGREQAVDVPCGGRVDVTYP